MSKLGKTSERMKRVLNCLMTTGLNQVRSQRDA